MKAEKLKGPTTQPPQQLPTLEGEERYVGQSAVGQPGITRYNVEPRVQCGEGNSSSTAVAGGEKSTAGNTSAWVAAVRGLGSELEGGAGGGGEGEGDGGHVFLETTYRLPTPCHVCHQMLRGHTRQGVKCKVCKVDIHHKCQVVVRD